MDKVFIFCGSVLVASTKEIRARHLWYFQARTLFGPISLIIKLNQFLPWLGPKALTAGFTHPQILYHLMFM